MHIVWNVERLHSSSIGECRVQIDCQASLHVVSLRGIQLGRKVCVANVYQLCAFCICEPIVVVTFFRILNTQKDTLAARDGCSRNGRSSGRNHCDGRSRDTLRRRAMSIAGNCKRIVRRIAHCRKYRQGFSRLCSAKQHIAFGRSIPLDNSLLYISRELDCISAFHFRLCRGHYIIWIRQVQ